MIKKSGSHIACWVSQLPIDYIDTTLTVNNWETVIANLSGGRPAKIFHIIVEQTNNGATAEDLELEITAAHPTTGVMTAYTFTLAASDSGDQIWCGFQTNQAASDFVTTKSTSSMTPFNLFTGNANNTIPWISRKISLIRVRQTSGVDATSAQIEVNIVWEKLVNL